jgi:hypothetical protein
VLQLKTTRFFEQCNASPGQQVPGHIFNQFLSGGRRLCREWFSVQSVRLCNYWSWPAGSGYFVGGSGIQLGKLEPHG